MKLRWILAFSLLAFSASASAAEFFVDFEGESTGATPPTDFTARWNTGAVEWGVVDEDADRSVYATPSGGSNEYRALIWDGASGPGSVSGDIELCALLKPSVAAAGHHIGLVLRSSNTGTAAGYFGKLIDFGTPSAGVDELDAGAFVDGDFTAVAWTADTLTWVRFGINGTSARIKVWNDGSSEPGSWTHTRDISGGGPLHTDGYVGLVLHNSSSNGVRYWMSFAVGTGADTAPCEGLAGGSVVNPISGRGGAAASPVIQ